MPQCYVDICGNYYEKTRGSKGIIYHMLPNDPVLAAKWVRACGKKEQKRPTHARVCSDHFSEKCYQRDLQHELLGLPLRKKLKSGAIPDKNLPKHQKLKSRETNIPPIPQKEQTKCSNKKINVINVTYNAHRPIIVPDDGPKKTIAKPSSPDKVKALLDLVKRKKDLRMKEEEASKRRKSTKIYDFVSNKNSSRSLGTKIEKSSNAEAIILKEKEEYDGFFKVNNKINKLPMRSSFRIAKKKSIECLSDSFTEKVNSKTKYENRPEKFTDKLKFMAKLQLKFERKENFLPDDDLKCDWEERKQYNCFGMPQCAVAGCNSTHRRTKGGSIKYHRFPGDNSTRNQWLLACGKILNNCSTARICSRHFSESSYERDVQHELLGLPTRCRLKRGAVPDLNLPNDFLKEEKQLAESAIAILLAVGLVPANNKQENSGGLPQDLNKMQIMENVREGCDVNPPSSPGHAEQGYEEDGHRVDHKREENEAEVVGQNGVKEEDGKDDVGNKIKEDNLKREKEEKQSDDDTEDKHEENSSHSSTSGINNKRQLDKDEPPIKRLKTEIEDSFLGRDRIINEFIEFAECNSIEQIHSYSEQLLVEIKTLNDLAKEKEREWNNILHMKKLKEELLLRLQRKRQVLFINDSDIGDFQPETNGQQSLLKCNQKTGLLQNIRARNIDHMKEKNLLSRLPLDINGSLDLRQKQKPLVDVQSIIADYRQRHPEVVPRRGRRIRHPNGDGKNSLMGNVAGEQKSVLESNSDMGMFLGSINGSRDSPRLPNMESAYADTTSYKDILVQFAKLSQSERTELQMQLKNSKPPPPYPEVTVHPVTSTSSAAPTNSLLHGILTKSPVRQTNHGNPVTNSNKTSFSPTLARLLTAPEKAAANISSATSILGGSILNSSSISDMFSSSKSKNEITITPVGNQYETTTKKECIDEESEEYLDRLVIDETSENLKRKDDNGSESGEEVPQCQGCNQKAAQFVCAGCGNQWYCSRECQVTAWDDHSEVCSG